MNPVVNARRFLLVAAIILSVTTAAPPADARKVPPYPPPTVSGLGFMVAEPAGEVEVDVSVEPVDLCFAGVLPAPPVFDVRASGPATIGSPTGESPYDPATVTGSLRAVAVPVPSSPDGFERPLTSAEGRFTMSSPIGAVAVRTELRETPFPPPGMSGSGGRLRCVIAGNLGLRLELFAHADWTATIATRDAIWRQTGYGVTSVATGIVAGPPCGGAGQPACEGDRIDVSLTESLEPPRLLCTRKGRVRHVPKCRRLGLETSGRDRVPLHGP